MADRLGVEVGIGKEKVKTAIISWMLTKHLRDMGIIDQVGEAQDEDAQIGRAQGGGMQGGAT